MVPLAHWFFDFKPSLPCRFHMRWLSCCTFRSGCVVVACEQLVHALKDARAPLHIWLLLALHFGGLVFCEGWWLEQRFVRLIQRTLREC